MKRTLKVGLLLLVPACALITGPDIDQQRMPFYYADGQRIYLERDPSRLTIETDQTDRASVEAMLARRRINADSVTFLSSVSRHWSVWLPNKRNLFAAEDALRRLRTTRGVTFESIAYRYNGQPLLLVNRVAVKYRADVTPEKMARLQRDFGLTLERESYGVWWLRYPAASVFTPLEIAAAYHHLREVEWAAPDMLATYVLLR